MKSKMKHYIQNHMKRAGTMTLAAVICLGGITFGSDFQISTSYANSGHWADSYLNNLVSQNVMKGDSSGALYPENPITRAEYIAMINRAFGYSQKATVKFKDVDKNAWYADDIAIAAKQGYFVGSGKNLASPDAYLKREEAVVMLCKALKIEGKEGSQFTFDDNKNFSNWSKEYINASAAKNYVAGYPDKTFRPTGQMKRGEMAKVLSEVAGYIVKDKGYSSYGYTKGNVTVVQSGASLRNTRIAGDLYITAGVGLGFTKLEGVTVGGDLIVSGTGESNAGENSIILTDCSINHLVLDSSFGKTISFRAEGETKIERTTIKSNTYLEEGNVRGTAFNDVILDGASGTTLNLSGSFEDVQIVGPANSLSLNKGSISRVSVDELGVGAKIYMEAETQIEDMFFDASSGVTGTGKVDSVIVNAAGVTMAMLPKNIVIRPGNSASINGKTMTSQEAEVDSLRPEIKGSYPKMEDVTAISANVLIDVNKPGKVYWILKEYGASGVSVDELMKPNTETALASGNLGVIHNKEVPIKLTGLKGGTHYLMQMVLVDLRGASSYIEKISFETIDNSALGFATGYPNAKLIDRNAFTMGVMPTKDATAYWALLPASSTAPTVDGLIAQSNLTGVLQKGTVSCSKTSETLISIPGLTDKTTYDFYVVMKDANGNKSKLEKLSPTTKEWVPLISFKETSAPTSPANLDIAFQIEPKEKASNDTYCYDTVLEADADAYFNLYEKVGGGNFVLIGNFLLPKAQPYTVAYFLNKKNGGGNTYTFDSFNTLATKEYAISFTELDGTTMRDTWSRNVTVTAKGIVGTKSNLTVVAKGAKDNLSKMITGGQIYQVNDPREFHSTAYFTDVVVPTLRSFETKGEETSITLTASADKNATLYYLAVKSGTVSATPSAMNLINGNYKPPGSKNGKLEMPYGDSKYVTSIDGLEPTTLYEIYYLLKGTPPESSVVKMEKVSTKAVLTPSFVDGPRVASSGDGSVTVSTTLDSTANIYWIVYPEGTLFPKGGAQPTAGEIKEKYNAEDAKAICYGEVSATKYKAITIPCNSLETEKYYSFYAVAQKEFGESSAVASIKSMTPLDKKPLQVYAVTTIDQATSPSGIYKCSGQLAMTFSKPLYYSTSANDLLVPLTKTILQDNMQVSGGTCSVTSSTNVDGAINGAVLNFTDMINNGSVRFNYSIYDKAGNRVGQLVMNFTVDTSNPTNSSFDVQFME